MTPVLAVALAAGIVGGGTPAALGLLVLAWTAPVPALVVVAGSVLLAARRPGRRGRSDPGSEASRIVALSGELRGGATLRSALGTLSPDVARLAVAGRPVAELAAAVEEALPNHGRLVSSVTLLADRLGGSVAALFEELAAVALDADDLARELRVAAAPAYVQGAIVGGLPLLALVRLLVSGDVGATGSPVAAAAAAVGVVLVAAGVLTVAVLVRRSSR